MREPHIHFTNNCAYAAHFARDGRWFLAGERLAFAHQFLMEGMHRTEHWPKGWELYTALYDALHTNQPGGPL